MYTLILFLNFISKYLHVFIIVYIAHLSTAHSVSICISCPHLQFLNTELVIDLISSNFIQIINVHFCNA